MTAIRETKEEIGIDINKSDLEFIGATTSIVNKGDIVDKHYNEYYIFHKDINTSDIILQEEEVQDIKWYDKKTLLNNIFNNYENLTEKFGCWQYLVKYFEIINNKKD